MDTLDLILKHKNEEGAIEFLLQEIKKGSLVFPYRRLYSPSPEEIFGRLKRYNPRYETNHYRLYGYFPRFTLFLPPFLSGSPLVAVNSKADLEQIDILPDLFFEDVRIRKSCSGKGGAWSTWIAPEKCRSIVERAIRLPRINYEELRRIIAMNEHYQFRATWAKAILSVLIRGRNASEDGGRASVLDISANYGEIMFPAMALDCDYLGFNSEPLINDSFDRAIAQLGNKTKHRVIHSRFEEIELSQTFDIVFTSIPLFDYENNANFPNVQDWTVEYLFRILLKAWSNLNRGGYLAIHLSDTKRFPVCEAMNLFIEQFLPGSSYEGVIGIVSEINKPRPVWVWKKDPINRHIWSPPIHKRPFCYLYPELKERIVIAQLSGMGAEFHQDCVAIKKGVSELIRELIHQKPILTRKMIVSILSEAILLNFIKHYGFADSIPMILKILQPWIPDNQQNPQNPQNQNQKAAKEEEDWGSD